MSYDQKLRLLQKPVRPRIIGKYLGQLFVALAILTLLPLAVSLLFEEYNISLRYLVVEAILLIPGILLARMSAASDLQTNEGIVITGLVFILSPLLMTIPFMGSGLHFIDALFEAVSAVTTTGLSTVTDLQDKPRTFLFSRAYMQWIGGLGIVVLTAALLLKPGPTLRKLIELEESEDIISSTRTYARRISIIYLILTIFSISIIWITSGNFFNAVTHALTAVSTGGFSSFDNSVAGFHSVTVALCVLLGSIFGALPLLLYFHIKQVNLLRIVQDVQVRAFFILTLILSILLAFSLSTNTTMPASEFLYHAPFMIISAQSTVGFSSLSVTQLGGSGMLILIIAMFIGGSLGSTAGGVKLYRISILLSTVRHMIQKSAGTPHAVINPHLGAEPLDTEEINRAMLVILLFIFTIFFSWLLFLFAGYAPIESLFEVVSAVGTVGLSNGITSIDLPDYLKLTLCVDMLLGRLEIIALLVLVYPITWINKRSTQ